VASISKAYNVLRNAARLQCDRQTNQHPLGTPDAKTIDQMENRKSHSNP
jgi:hypothetical protein